MLQRVRCTIYCVLTSRIRSLPQYWSSIRTCHLLQWVQEKALSEACCDALLKKEFASTVLAEDNLSSMCQFAASHGKRSLLHADTPPQLMSLIFTVFKDGGEGPGWDNARKKAMQFITTLLEMQASLTKFAWPIVRQSVCDEIARVRESSIPLLQALLTKLLQPLTDENTNIAMNGSLQCFTY